MLKVAGGGIGAAGGLSYQGTWNANTNTPALTSGVGTNGQYYLVSVAGSTNLDGITDWAVGDWAIFNGTAWQKIDNSDLVQSVNGQTGVVVLNAVNVGATPNTAYVNTSGLLTGGGQLTGNVTVDLTSVPVANVPGAVPNTVNVLSSGLLSGGGALTGNVTISLNSVPVANVTGLGTMATQNSNNVTITGGNITGTSITQNATPLIAGMVYGSTDPRVYSPAANVAGAWFAETSSTSLYTSADGDYNGQTDPENIVVNVANGTIAVGQTLTLVLTEISSGNLVQVDAGAITAVSYVNTGIVFNHNASITFTNAINWSLYVHSSVFFYSRLIVTALLVSGNNAGSVFLGYKAGNNVTSGGQNTIIGSNAAPSVITGNNNIVIGGGADASGDVSNEATIGTTSITKTRLYGAVAFNNSYGSSGQLLVSQGNSAAPQWTAAANVAIGTANVANSTVGTLTLGTGLTGTSFNGSANVTTNLANTAVTAGDYGSSSNVGSFTVDAQGRLTAAANVTIVATQVNLSNTSSTVTFATSSLPLVPEGYIVVQVNGVNKKIPYYGV